MERTSGGVRYSRRSMLRGAGLGLAGLTMGPGALIAACGGDGGVSRTGDQGQPEDLSSGVASGADQLETGRIRLARTYAGCTAPLLTAEPFLQQEGFTQIEFITDAGDFSLLRKFADGSIDFGYFFIPDILHAIDLGMPLVILGGANTACFQVVATPDIRTVSDLRGKRVAQTVYLPGQGIEGLAFLYSVLQLIGFEPGVDVEVSQLRNSDLLTGLGDKVDAVQSYVPALFSVVDNSESHVLIDSRRHAPWANKYCCGFLANRKFVKNNPVATKKALRSMLRAFESCTNDPISAAGQFVDRAWIRTRPYAERVLQEVQLDVWRQYEPEDSVLFFANALYEVGVVKTTGQQFLTDHTDLRFFHELRQETW